MCRLAAAGLVRAPPAGLKDAQHACCHGDGVLVKHSVHTGAGLLRSCLTLQVVAAQLVSVGRVAVLPVAAPDVDGPLAVAPGPESAAGVIVEVPSNS